MIFSNSRMMPRNQNGSLILALAFSHCIEESFAMYVIRSSEIKVELGPRPRASEFTATGS